MQHRIAKPEAIALANLITTMQPGWDYSEFLTALREHRDQHDIGAFIKQLVDDALNGELIETAMRPVEAHVCPQLPATPDEAWIAGSSNVVDVVNESDPTKSVLLRKRKAEAEIVRPPSDDPNHWRNRFAHNIEQGKQEREELLMQNRAAEPQTQTQQLVRDTLNEFADSFLPEHSDIRFMKAGDPDIKRGDIVEWPTAPQSAPAAAGHHQGVPTSSPSSPASQETVSIDFEDLTIHDSDDWETKMRKKSMQAARRRAQVEAIDAGGLQKNRVDGEGWQDHNPDK